MTLALLHFSGSERCDDEEPVCEHLTPDVKHVHHLSALTHKEWCHVESHVHLLV